MKSVLKYSILVLQLPIIIVGLLSGFAFGAYKYGLDLSSVIAKSLNR